MNEPNHVVLYTPVEYALYNSGYLFPLICAAVVAVALAVLADWLCKLAPHGTKIHKLRSEMAMVGVLLGFAGTLVIML